MISPSPRCSGSNLSTAWHITHTIPPSAPKLDLVTDTAPHPRNPAPAVLKLSCPAEVVAAVPYLLGFQPADSIVLLSLRGPRHRVGLTLRADLPPPEGVTQAVAEIVGYLRRDGAEAVIAVFYAAAPDAAETWLALSEALRQADLTLREALRISEGRWWSYLCTVPACCPTAGTVILSPHSPGGPARVGAELVSAGLVALGSREELADTVRAADPAALAAVDAVLAVAAEQVVRRVVRPGGLAACRREWQRHLVRVLGERASSPHPARSLTDEELAGLLIAIADQPTRDSGCRLGTWTRRGHTGRGGGGPVPVAGTHPPGPPAIRRGAGDAARPRRVVRRQRGAGPGRGRARPGQ